MPIWTAYSRRQGKVVAYVIGKSKDCARQLYNKAKSVVGKITRIYTDGNSCYKEVFTEMKIVKRHYIAPGKSQTHRIESSNSSIRDNLARFNRKSKRYSKRQDMLDDTLLLFFNIKWDRSHIVRPINIR